MGGSKLLDGIWSRSAESSSSDLCSDSGRSLFDLFHDDYDADDDCGRSDKSTASSDVNPATDQFDTKYYTPFGSGISIGSFTRPEVPPKSFWSTERPESRNGVIGKPPPVTGKFSAANKFHAVTKVSDVGRMKVPSSKQIEELNTTVLSGPPLVHTASNKKLDKSLPGILTQNCQQRDAFSHPVLSTCQIQMPLPLKSMGVPSGGGKSTSSISVEQREKQILATQQMFMHELNRLPPDLRKQYVDYMFATRLGILPAGTSPAVPAVPAGTYYNVAAVGPGAVPITPLYGAPLFLPAGPVMPTPVVTFQPVVPSAAAVNKSVTR